jgi:hypothetical protein
MAAAVRVGEYNVSGIVLSGNVSWKGGKGHLCAMWSGKSQSCTSVGPQPRGTHPEEATSQYVSGKKEATTRFVLSGNAVSWVTVLRDVLGGL